MSTHRVAAFYQFADFPEFQDWRPLLSEMGERLSIKGSILLANEGINGTISASPEALEELFQWIRKDPRFADMPVKYSEHDGPPFYRLKVRLKKEIVTMGVSGLAPHRKTGKRLSPAEWNQLLTDPDVLLIDTRNTYECELGKFQGAIEPQTDSFREFPQYVEQQLEPHKNRKIAMYCTGGIRCEKASAYMLEKGFEEVYQLDGGILRYLEETEQQSSKWQGECFVFDQRVSVNHDLHAGEHTLCGACRHALSPADLAHPHYEAGVSCPHCHDTLTEAARAAARERQLQLQLAKARGERHLGATPAEFVAKREAKRLRKRPASKQSVAH